MNTHLSTKIRLAKQDNNEIQHLTFYFLKSVKRLCRLKFCEQQKKKYFVNDRKKYFIQVLYLFWQHFYKIKMENQELLQPNIESLLEVFNEIFADKETNSQFANHFATLMTEKKHLLPSTIFDDVHGAICSEQYEFEKIIELLQNFFQDSSIRKKRKSYLIVHWLYYQFSWIQLYPINEELLPKIQELFGKKISLTQIIQSIGGLLGFAQSQRRQVMSNMEKSKLFSEVEKMLTVSVQLSPQKIKEKHQQLIYIMRKMNLFSYVVEFELQKHILVEFEKRYHQRSSQGEEALNSLMPLKDLIQLFVKNGRMNDKAKRSFQELKLATEEVNKYNILEGIKKEITVLDVFLLDRLITLTMKNISHEQDGKKSYKDIALFVGPSGSGKTTIILSLLGYNLIETQIEGLETLQPQDLRPEHQALQTSPESTSTTRYMFTAKIPKESFPNGLSKDLYACDSPGFEDTAGPEVDVSNSISILQALRQCASVKLVVVISQRRVGQKMEGIREIAKIVSNIVISYKQIDEKVTVIFNKFDCQKQFDRLAPGINSILKSLTPAEQTQPQYVNFLRSLLKRLNKNKTYRFNPKDREIKEQLIEEMCEGAIDCPKDVFKYSLSQKSSQAINSRRQQLMRLIRQNLGKHNESAYYYFKELQLMSKCLKQNVEIQVDLSNLKEQIRKQTHQKFKVFEKRIETEIIENEANNNTYNEINKICEEIKTYEIFADSIENLVTSNKFKAKLDDVKKSMIDNIQNLAYSEDKIEETKGKLMNTVRFFKKFESEKVEQVHQKLLKYYHQEKINLLNLLAQKQFRQIRKAALNLKNILQAVEKINGQIKKDQKQINPEKNSLSLKDQLTGIKGTIVKTFEQIVDESTRCLKFESQIKMITTENITFISGSTEMFESLEGEGPILTEIYPRTYKTMIITVAGDYGRKVIEQANKILDPSNVQSINDSNIEKIKIYKANTMKIKQIHGVYNVIGDLIDRLWTGFSRYIDGQTQQLSSFLDDLKAKKNINRKSLKHFKTKIDRVIKFSEGDQNLVISINKLKTQIKKNLILHIKALKTKVEKTRLTIKLKRSIQFDQVSKFIEIFKEIQAFYKIKEFNNKDYFAVNNDAEASKLKHVEESDESDAEQMDTSQVIQEMYREAIKKLLYPFVQIGEECKKFKEKHMGNVTLNYLKILDDFLLYKLNLEDKDITFNKQFTAGRNQLMNKEDNYITSVQSFLTNIRTEFENLYSNAIASEISEQQIYKLQISKIKQFKKFVNFVLKIKSHTYLEQLFLEEKFFCNDYIEKILEMLKKSHDLINEQVVCKKQKSIEYINKILNLKEKVEEMRSFDELQLNRERQHEFQFTKIYENLTKQINSIEGKQSNAISNLFKDETIIMEDVKNMYHHLCQDQHKNQDKIATIYSHLKQTARNLKILTQRSREQMEGEEPTSFENIETSNSYITKLEKSYKFYEGLNEFLDRKFMDAFTLNEAYFITEISQLEFEDKLRQTYQIVKGKLCAFEYKKKSRDFQKIINIIKKVEYIVSKLTKDTLYSKIYTEIQDKQAKQVDKQQIKTPKLSERLKYYQAKCNNQFNNTFVQYRSAQDKNKEDFLYDSNFLNIYNKVQAEQKSLIEAKIDEVVVQKLTALKNSYQKTEQQRIIIEEEAKNIVDRLPNRLKQMYRQKVDVISYQMQQKIKQEVNVIKSQLNPSIGANIFRSVCKMEEIRNPIIEKQCLNIIEKQLKVIEKQIFVIGDGKKIKIIETFKCYLKIFGHQNSQMLKKGKNNKKIRQLLENGQRSIYNSIIYEMKERIRQIQNDLTRCSRQIFSSFEKKCDEMNEIYKLIVEDDYQGLCVDLNSQCLKIWENFLKHINDKIKNQFTEYPKIILANRPTPMQLERHLSQLKFMRIFVNSLIKCFSKTIKNESQRFVFIKELYMHIQNFSTDQKYSQQLKEQMHTIISGLKRKEFYDDLIKVLSSTTLQTQFERQMEKPLKMLRQYQSIYNIQLSERESDKYSTQQLVNSIRKKWEQFTKTCFIELDSAVTHHDEEISQKIVTLYNLAQIICKKKWNFIDKSLQSKDIVQETLENTFKNLTIHYHQDLERIDQINHQKELIIKRYVQTKKKSEEIFQKMNDQTRLKMEELQTIIDSNVDDEARQKLSLQFQNIEQLNNEKIEAIKSHNYQEHQKERQFNNEALKSYIRDRIVKQLIIMKKFVQSVNWRTKENGYIFIQSLNQLNKKSKEINQIIYKELQAANNNYALVIAAEADIFKSQAALQFKNKTAKQDIHYIVTRCPEINHDRQLKQEILKFYSLYEAEYNRIIDEFKKNPDTEQIDIVAKQLRDQKDRNDHKKLKDSTPIPITIARIFATWSMMKVDLSSKEQISIDFQPHPAQIVAIFLLTGFNDTKLSNSLVEVLTGEGKSIVLAGLCCYLALKGYYPYCACYSQYLSSRDQKQFKQLFLLLQITDRIKYGTFNMHCEDIINQMSSKNEKGRTFRQHMRLVVTNKADKSTIEYFSRIFDPQIHQRSKKVLIIDEADVFFNQNFFGRLYCPSLSLEDEQIKALIELIWKTTKDSRQNDQLIKVKSSDIYESNEFKKVLEKYNAIQEIIKAQVIGMLQAVYSYQHGYIIHQQSIKYRDNDTITHKISFGYKTVFANCYQYERKAISQISYSSALKITLNIAPFSYSELPTFFQAILGVSGTVDSMSDYKKQMLNEKYRIEETYKIPSIYGDSQRTQDKFTIVKDEGLYDNIVAHTKLVLEAKRPIGIFFKTIKDVTNFYRSPQFKELTKYATILSEQTDHEMREVIIKRVGQAEKITIMTESFSRGTDFKIFDKRIDDKGGLHIIQTFISADLSEYIQSRGRTARQGNKGSYQMLINQTQLERFELPNIQIEKFQEALKNGWKKKNQIECQQLRVRVESSKIKHGNTERLFRNKSSKDEIIQFIFNHNKFAQIRSNHVRTLIGIDGTASMGQALKQVSNILEDGFIRTKKILQDKQVAGSFENGIAIYRNYDSDHEQVLEYSGFEANSENLQQFLNKVQISGGWGNQAMEVLFQYANKLSKLDQIIIIADARANVFKETQYKRGRKGENYWNDSNFPIANQTQQVIKLKNKKIKVHTLYIYLDSANQIKRQQLKEYCERISQQTNGTSTQLKLKDANAADFLTAFLVKNILGLIGGQERGKELMESYDKQFGPMRL